MTLRLYLIRHGEVAARKGAYFGSTDLSLSEAGVQQLEELRKVLPAGIQTCSLWYSPLTRCGQTAEILFPNHTNKAVDTVLREIDFGAWEGLSFEDISRRTNPECLNQWAAFSEEFTFPGGDCLGDFCSRMDTLAERIRKSAEPALALVTHGGVIRHLICSLLGIPQKMALSFHIPYGSISVMDVFDEGACLLNLNALSAC